MSSQNKESVFPTRQTLGLMKNKLKGAQTGHDLLKRKSEALTKYEGATLHILHTLVDFGLLDASGVTRFCPHFPSYNTLTRCRDHPENRRGEAEDGSDHADRRLLPC